MSSKPSTMTRERVCMRCCCIISHLPCPAFQQDLVNQGLADRVTTVTFSEFGRQVKENANRGTDHGTLAPMLIMGKGIKPGISGVNPDYSNLLGNSFTGMQYDYRQVFTTLLQDWMGGSSNALAQTQFSTFENQKLDLVNDQYLDLNLANPINYVANPNCFEVSFPVSLNYFQATLTPELSVRLDWETASELNNSHFVIERSADGQLFEQLQEVKGYGTSSVPIRYESWDFQPFSGRSWYRLKQVDFDGTTTLYNKVEVILDPGKQARVKVVSHPNPADEEMQLKISSSEGMPVRFRLYDVEGKRVRESNWEISTGENQYRVNVEALKPGVYFGELTTGLGNSYQYRRLARFRQVILR